VPDSLRGAVDWDDVAIELQSGVFIGHKLKEQAPDVRDLFNLSYVAGEVQPQVQFNLPQLRYTLVALATTDERDLRQDDAAFAGLSLMRAAAAGDVVSWLRRNSARLRLILECVAGKHIVLLIRHYAPHRANDQQETFVRKELHSGADEIGDYAVSADEKMPASGPEIGIEERPRAMQIAILRQMLDQGVSPKEIPTPANVAAEVAAADTPPQFWAIRRFERESMI